MIVSIVLTSLNLFARINIVSKIAKFKQLDFIIKVILPIISVVAVSIVLPVSIKFLLSTGIIEFLIMVFISVLSVVTTIYFIGLNNIERGFVKTKMKALILKLKLK